MQRSIVVRVAIGSFVLGAMLASSWLICSHWCFIFLAAAAAFLVGLVWFIKCRFLMLWYLVLAMLALGAGWSGWYQKILEPTPGFFAPYEGRGAVVAEPVSKKSYQQLIVRLDGGQRVLMRAELYSSYEYGDELEVSGEIERPEAFVGDNGKVFNYPQYLLMRYRVVGTMDRPQLELVSHNNGNAITAGILKIKRSLQNAIVRVLPEPQAALAQGLLVGEDDNFSDSFKEAMRRTGTSHIVAISGYNITIVIMIFFLLVRRIAGFKIALGSGFAALLLFVVLTGASASVVRAAIMGSLFLLAKVFGRQNRIDYTVFLAAFGMTAANPLVPRFDVGFQLSFLAVLGLVYFSPIIDKFLERFWHRTENIWGGVREALVATCAAQFLTMPLVAALFGQISIIAPITNMILLPIIPLTMALCFGVAIMALVSLTLGQVASILAWLPLTFFTMAINGMARWHFASFSIPEEYFWGWFAIWSAIVLAIWMWGARSRKQSTAESLPRGYQLSAVVTDRK